MKILNYDTHAHIDLYKDREECIRFIEKANSYTIAVTNLPELYQKYIKAYEGYNYVKFALGLHPQLVTQYKYQLSLFCELVKDSKYIGEVGLDFSNGIDQEQIEVFKAIIRSCQLYGRKIISVHSRRAVSQVIDIIDEGYNNKIILHWFTGTIKELERAINLGYYFSINTNMINSTKGKEVVRRIPLDRLLIESDAPFTDTLKQKYNLDFINIVIARTADILNKTEQETRNIYSNNFINLLK